ncbi:hypothetical protein [Aminicella lysinilytica]|uniref:Uncharacterized protein n=1 Tax=Aminicella lysinilytica TaxID=433323 RepID=A0A4R6QD17_9FIRM|nr:hypothetical protein [Aminicella lysinilytica]TDP59856.1 hypothetical protein EV211_10298 [Aminicella lysinilytica]
MKYYKQISDDTVISYGISDTIPEGAEEVTKTAYTKIVKDQDAVDKAAANKRAAAAEAARQAAEQAAAERKATVDDWIAKVTAGTSTLANVPEEYRYEVQEATDPTPTNRELHESLESTQEAVDFLMTE